MKLRQNLRIIFIVIFISIVFSNFTLTENKTLLRKKTMLKDNQSFTENMLGSTSNTYSGTNDRSAVTFGAAGEFSKIPSNHPLLTYVEQLGYYEDQPKIDSEVEAVSINREGEDYYHPFPNKHLNFEAREVFNCENLVSPYVCLESSLCGWDNMVKICHYTQVVHSGIRFKQNYKQMLRIKNNLTRKSRRRSRII